jgi:hypothetical protein
MSSNSHKANMHCLGCWVKEVFYRSHGSDSYMLSFTKLRWQPFSGWSSTPIHVAFMESPITLPFCGNQLLDGEEIYGSTTDKRIMWFLPANPSNTSTLPTYVASPSNTIQSLAIKLGDTTVKAVFFFVSADSALLNDKLALTIWSDVFPLWVGPQLLPQLNS